MVIDQLCKNNDKMTVTQAKSRYPTVHLKTENPRRKA